MSYYAIVRYHSEEGDDGETEEVFQADSDAAARERCHADFWYSDWTFSADTGDDSWFELVKEEGK